jgi:pimeloyl-ACP methyl ester carboxylesterase
VPVVRRPDGAQIHWEATGEGHLVVVLPALWTHPEVYAGLTSDLARDHRVVTYHQRGCGQSSAAGPFDVETDTDDLAAVVHEAGGRAVVVTVANGTNCAVRIAARDPDLVTHVVAVGPADAVVLPRAELHGEGVLASQSVAEMLVTMLGTDPRAAAHAIISATNPQLDEKSLRARVEQASAYYYSAEAVEARARAWLEDDAREPTRAIGSRLLILSGGEGLFDSTLAERVTELFPEARREAIADGPISRPDLTAEWVRRLTSGAAPAA